MKRPLSPHLGIYKLPFAAVMSIIHRITGVGLFFSLILFSWIIVYLVNCNFSVSTMNCISNSIILKSAIWLASYAFFYHAFNGIRYLVWASGCGINVKAMGISGWIVLFLSIIFTTSFWLF